MKTSIEKRSRQNHAPAQIWEIWFILIWKAKSRRDYIWKFKDWDILYRLPIIERRQAVKVGQYTMGWEYIKIFKSQSDAGRELWLDSSSISRTCKGINKHCWNFIFKLIY